MNPAFSMWLNLLMTGFSGATAAIAGTSASGSSAAMWAGVIGSIVGGLNVALHATSPSTAGPLGH